MRMKDLREFFSFRFGFVSRMDGFLLVDYTFVWYKRVAGGFARGLQSGGVNTPPFSLHGKAS